MTAVVYDFKGFGVARAVYTLSSQRLEVALPGPQVGKGLHEVEIPVADITGFYVTGAYAGGGLKTRAAFGAAKAARLNNGELWVSWIASGKRKTKSFSMVSVEDSGFRDLVTELARLRPDADLRALPRQQAAKRLGRMSDQVKALLFIGGVFVFLALAVVGKAAWDALMG